MFARAYREHMELHMAARFGEFVAVPRFPDAEYRNHDFLYVGIESGMGGLMYQHRPTLCGLKTARGVLTEDDDAASRMGDFPTQPIQDRKTLELGAISIDEAIRGAAPLTHEVLGPCLTVFRSPRPVGVRSAQ